MFEMVPPSEEESYFIVAKKLYAGVETLSNFYSGVELPYSLLAGHSLECALKAYLSCAGIDQKELKKEFGHNLEKLWSMANKKGMAISSEPSNWCVTLNSAHDKPYLFRYPMQLNGMGFPNPQETIKGLKHILSLVEASITAN